MRTRRATTAAGGAVSIPSTSRSCARSRRPAATTACWKASSISYYETASRQSGITGENLLRLLELRLDNVVYRLGFGASRRQARQLVRHGHFMVNGRKVNIPSYRVRPDDVITAVLDSEGLKTVVEDATDLTASVPAWLQADHDNMVGKVLRTA